MNIFKRFITAWKLSKNPDIQDADTVVFSKNGKLFPWTPPVEGDGKAVFIDEGTEADWLEQEKEDQGLLGIFGLGKKKPEIISQEEI